MTKRALIAALVVGSLLIPALVIGGQDPGDASATETDPAGVSAFGQRGLWRGWSPVPEAAGSLVLGSSFGFFYIGDYLADGDSHLGMGGSLSLVDQVSRTLAQVESGALVTGGPMVVSADDQTSHITLAGAVQLLGGHAADGRAPGL